MEEVAWMSAVSSCNHPSSSSSSSSYYDRTRFADSSSQLESHMSGLTSMKSDDLSSSHGSSRYKVKKSKYPSPPPKGTFRSAHAMSVYKVLASDTTLSLADINPFVIPAPYGYDEDTPLITPVLDPPLSSDAWPEIAERRRARRRELKRSAEQQLPFSMFCRALEPNVELYLPDAQSRPRIGRTQTHNLACESQKPGIIDGRSSTNRVSMNAGLSLDQKNCGVHGQRAIRADNVQRRTLPGDELEALVQSVKEMGVPSRHK